MKPWPELDACSMFTRMQKYAYDDMVNSSHYKIAFLTNPPKVKVKKLHMKLISHTNFNQCINAFKNNETKMNKGIVTVKT